jgi:hypothetical protein
MALAARGFVTADRKRGVMYAPTEERNNQIANELNVTERRLVMQFAQTFAQYGDMSKMKG